MPHPGFKDRALHELVGTISSIKRCHPHNSLWDTRRRFSTVIKVAPMQFNGWRKLGLVLSFIWAFGTCALYAVAIRQDVGNAAHSESQYAQSTCEIDVREAAATRKEFIRSCAIEAKAADKEGRRTYWSNIGAGFYVFIGLVALLPVFAAWAIVYAIIGIQRWMRLNRHGETVRLP